MSEQSEAFTLNEDGNWSGQTIEWTKEDRDKFRAAMGVTEERKRLHQLYSDGSAQLEDADHRLALQADRVGELAERLSSGEPGELSPEDCTALCYLASAWLLRTNLDQMVRADPRVKYDPEKTSSMSFAAGETLVDLRHLRFSGR